MTIYSDLTETTDYETFDTYEGTTEVYEEPAASCCCSGEVEADYSWPEYEPTPAVYDVPEDDGSVWTDPQPAASAVIPAGQPGGPALVGDIDPGWDPEPDHQGLYGTVAPIADQAPATYATNGFGTGFSALASTPDDSTFSGSFTGTGFSALASTSDSGFSSSFTGTGFSALDTTSPSPLATTMTINSEVNPLGQLIAKAATEGDIMTQITLGRVQLGQSWIGGSWL